MAFPTGTHFTFHSCQHVPGQSSVCGHATGTVTRQTGDISNTIRHGRFSVPASGAKSHIHRDTNCLFSGGNLCRDRNGYDQKLRGETKGPYPHAEELGRERTVTRGLCLSSVTSVVCHKADRCTRSQQRDPNYTGYGPRRTRVLGSTTCHWLRSVLSDFLGTN